MTIDYAYQFLQFLSRKNQTGTIQPAEFQFAINSGSRGNFDFLIGRVEQFQYSVNLPRVALGMSTKIAEDLAPFKITGTIISVTYTIATYPADFYKLALMMDLNNKKIERIDDTRIPSRLNSVIDPFSESGKSFYTEADTGWKIYGIATSIYVNYYRLPIDMVWGYTLDGQGRPVYDAGTSVQPEWSDAAMEEVLGRAAKILGISFEARNLVEYGEHVIQTGE
jgi:hypothetical protein